MLESQRFSFSLSHFETLYINLGEIIGWCEEVPCARASTGNSARDVMKEHISINGFSSFQRLQEGTALLAKPTVLTPTANAVPVCREWGSDLIGQSPTCLLVLVHFRHLNF